MASGLIAVPDRAQAGFHDPGRVLIDSVHNVILPALPAPISDQSMGVPTVLYDAADSTLDGLVQVEADLIEAFPIGDVAIPIAGNAYVGFDNLGAQTSVALNEDTSVLLESEPATGQIYLGATVHSKLDRVDLDLDLFDKAGFTGTLTGYIEVPEIRIDDFQLSIDDIQQLQILPGKNLSYLTTGIDGDYQRLLIEIDEVFIDPDVDLKFAVDIPGPFNFEQDVVLDEPITGIRFHRSDLTMRDSGEFDLDVACLRIETLPGKTATDINRIEVFGEDGPQVLNYLDPEPFPLDIPREWVSTAIDLLTVYYTYPFDTPEATADYHPSLGGC